MGRSNLTALASQNIVALCDVDFGYVDRKYADLSVAARAGAQADRRAQGQPERATAGAGPRPRHDARGPAGGRRAACRQRRGPDRQGRQGEALPGLPPDAGGAEGHRRRRRGDARSHARGDRAWRRCRSASTSTCRSRSAGRCTRRARWRRRRPRPRSPRRWATRATRSDDARKAIEYIQGGYIGDVKEVHVWTNRPHRLLAAGRAAPRARHDEARGARVERRAASPSGSARRWRRATTPVPQGMAWDLFLGPAPEVPYHPIYHPFNWRGWVDWGQGALGDMGAHLIDHPFWALELGMPTTIETVSTPFNGASLPDGDDDALRVRRARQQAGGEADVVRRRLHAAAPGGARRDEARSRKAACSTSAARAS